MIRALFDIQKVFTNEHTCHYELYYKYNSSYKKITETEFKSRYDALVYVDKLIEESN